MSFLNLGEVCLFSETKGRITLNNKPISGAKIERSTIWQNKTIRDSTVSDEFGNFHFDIKITNSISKYMPVEAVISQSISIEYNGKNYLAWKTTKRDYAENSELNGKTIELDCDLANEISTKEVGFQIIKGLCQWK